MRQILQKWDMCMSHNNIRKWVGVALRRVVWFGLIHDAANTRQRTASFHFLYKMEGSWENCDDHDRVRKSAGRGQFSRKRRAVINSGFPTQVGNFFLLPDGGKKTPILVTLTAISTMIGTYTGASLHRVCIDLALCCVEALWITYAIRQLQHIDLGQLRTFVGIA